MTLKIEIISASAGSGKTTRIARELRQRVERKTARPEAVLATTFTRMAADELKQRVRSALFEKGLVDEAMQLEGARIGTVNAVCGRLVSDFAFELGLSPELRVIDETQAEVTLKHVISRVVTQDERDTLAELGARFEALDWQADVERLLVLARTNLLSAEQLLDSQERSLRGLLDVLPPPRGEAEARDAEMLKACHAALEQVDPEDTTQTTEKTVAVTTDLIAALKRGPAPWKAWGKALAGTFKPGAKSKGAFDEVAALARDIDSHPRLRDDLQRLVTLVFTLTARVMGAYEAEKRELGVLDFVDQETLAHTLLRKPEFATRLSEQLDLVLVDEFQDTSPLQLSIFTRLAELAKASVWVGDQKQAIFGFRGTDPALMDATLEAVLGDRAPEVLAHSHRSRPGLVDLTSELFARAFAPHGLPAERVRLAAFNQTDVKGLGEFLEWWKVDGRNGETRRNQLADGVSRLLADPTVRVRGKDGARPLRHGDVAVLCRRNAECQAVATELARKGIAATVKRAGLMSTPEARVAVLGLQLFVDPRDRLAAAELALLLQHGDDPDAWLAAVVSRPEGELPFASAPFHAAIAAARDSAPSAGALLSLTLATDALQLESLLPRWGQADVRMANLDALRAHACDYVGKAEADGAAATAAGLLTFLHELEAEALDTQAVLPGEDAVVVSTWHAAKGLEWPVTVLFFDGEASEPDRFGLAVRSTKAGFSMANPLEGRWVRYWPNPFHPSQNTTLKTQLDAAPEAELERLERQKQELRLLYVGWTRARDRLVLATSRSNWMLAPLEPPSPPTDSGVVRWAERDVQVVVRRCEAFEADVEQPPPDVAVVLPPPRPHVPALVAPSTLASSGSHTAEAIEIGQRALVGPGVEMDALGQALHGFLAADRASVSSDERRALAQRSLESWGQGACFSPDAMVAASNALMLWAVKVAPDATWHRELPVQQLMPNGSMLRGTADLVLETEKGFHLVDHKSFPGTAEQAVARAVSHAAQLDAYATSITAATNKPCLSKSIHLPVLGLVVTLT